MPHPCFHKQNQKRTNKKWKLGNIGPNFERNLRNVGTLGCWNMGYMEHRHAPKKDEIKASTLEQSAALLSVAKALFSSENFPSSISKLLFLWQIDTVTRCIKCVLSISDSPHLQFFWHLIYPDLINSSELLWFSYFNHSNTRHTMLHKCTSWM